MSTVLRSKQGYWTCKLRRKNCDEMRPYCSTRETLAIPCYGFGPRPEWMDAGDNEREVKNSLKEIVKRTSRRKPGSQLADRRDAVLKIATRFPENHSKDSLSITPRHAKGFLQHGDEVPSQELGSGIEQDISTVRVMHFSLGENQDPMTSRHPFLRRTMMIRQCETTFLPQRGRLSC